jgi:chemotaxis protein methyltransferase CheR
MPDGARLEQAGLWAGVSQWLEAETGLHFPPTKWADLQRGLAAAASRLGFSDAASLGRRLLARPPDDAQRDVLAQCLAIGETYFFRDPGLLDSIGAEVLWPLLQARRHGTRHLRLWSAACSTGEEPYSLALLVASLLPDWRDWNISILATDNNRAALDKARAGSYGPWSLRGGVPASARTYLRRQPDGSHAVAPEIRALVRFEPLNLVKDRMGALLAAGGMDLVLCRNVLIYFERERAQQVLGRLGDTLVPGGWLVTGSVEAPTGSVPGLSHARLGGLTVLRKMPWEWPVAAAASVPAPIRLPAPPAAPQRPAVEAVSTRVAAPPDMVPEAAAPAQPEEAEAAALGRESRSRADAGELERAEQLCRAAMAQEKLNPEWPYLLSSILSEQGAAGGATRALQRTLYLDPGHVLARFSLGSLALRQGAIRTGRKHLALALTRLDDCAPDEVLRGSGGLSARELRGIILNMRGAE